MVVVEEMGAEDVVAEIGFLHDLEEAIAGDEVTGTLIVEAVIEVMFFGFGLVEEGLVIGPGAAPFVDEGEAHPFGGIEIAVAVEEDAGGKESAVIAELVEGEAGRGGLLGVM